jgi:hypothetical protein
VLEELYAGAAAGSTLACGKHACEGTTAPDPMLRYFEQFVLT